MKPVPAGKKGKGLRKLPKPVRNKMGFMKYCVAIYLELEICIDVQYLFKRF